MAGGSVVSGPGDWSPPTDRQRWGEAEGRAMAEAFRRSGLTTVEFARRHGIGEWRVRRWTRRRDRKAGAAGLTDGKVRFAPVRLAGTGSSAVVEVVVGRATIRVGADFDEELLRRVVNVLGGSGC